MENLDDVAVIKLELIGSLRLEGPLYEATAGSKAWWHKRTQVRRLLLLLLFRQLLLLLLLSLSEPSTSRTWRCRCMLLDKLLDNEDSFLGESASFQFPARSLDADPRSSALTDPRAFVFSIPVRRLARCRAIPRAAAAGCPFHANQANSLRHGYK
jgi:hypothetical protein